MTLGQQLTGGVPEVRQACHKPALSCHKLASGVPCRLNPHRRSGPWAAGSVQSGPKLSVALSGQRSARGDHGGPAMAGADSDHGSKVSG